MNQSYVYLWQNSVNGKVYVGKGTRYRARDHIRNALAGKRSCPVFYDAIRKYGAGCFTVRLLAAGISDVEACEIERDAIAEYRPNVYNLTDGGTGGATWVPTPEHVARLAERMKGNTQNIGRKHSAEVRARMGGSLRVGVPLTAAHRAACSAGRKGMVFSESHRSSMRRVFTDTKRASARMLAVLGARNVDIARWLEVTAQMVCLEMKASKVRG